MRHQDDVVSRFDSMESPDFGLLGKVTTAAVSTTATLAVAAAAGVASKGQDITTGLSAMASATPTERRCSSKYNIQPLTLLLCLHWRGHSAGFTRV